MAQDMKIWRANARVRLREQLGGICVDCGTTKNLTFSHVVPLSDEQHEYRVKVGSNKRLVLYRREAAEGLLCLRCQSCNNRQAAEPRQGFLTYDAPTVQPF